MTDFIFKDKKLGKADLRSHYDVPLQKTKGSEFLSFLVFVMTLLCLLTIVGYQALTSYTNDWRTGLENKTTIEISVDVNQTQSRDEIYKTAQKIKDTLQNVPSVKNVEILKSEQIEELLSPWFGEDISFETFPVPILLALEWKEFSIENADNVRELISNISKDAKLDTHDEWLGTLIKVTSFVRVVMIFVMICILVITLLSVGGAIQSQMAIHKENIEILHVMGAKDWYITKQFCRYILLLSFKGSFFALMVLFCVIGALTAFSDIGGFYSLSALFSLQLFIMPVVLVVLSTVLTGIIILNKLQKMP